jgi:hypothetical protein
MPFKGANNNTWILMPSDDIKADSPLGVAAAKAREYLERVIQYHPGTPWELLAKHELQIPLNWTWAEEYTDLAPHRGGMGGDGGMGGGEMRRDVERKPPKRAPPRL